MVLNETVIDENDSANVSRTVKLTPRQVSVIEAMGGEPPLSQYVREAVEMRLIAEVPGYGR